MILWVHVPQTHRLNIFKYCLKKERKSKIRLSPCWGFGETADTMKLSKESETRNLETTATGKWPGDQNPIFSLWELKSMKKEMQAAGGKTQVIKCLQVPEFYFQHMCEMLGVGTLITLVIPALDRWQRTDLWLAGQTAYTAVSSAPMRDLRKQDEQWHLTLTSDLQRHPHMYVPTNMNTYIFKVRAFKKRKLPSSSKTWWRSHSNVRDCLVCKSCTWNQQGALHCICETPRWER